MLFFGSVLVLLAIAAAQPVVTISSNIAASPGGKVTIPLNVTGVAGEDVGGYSVRLDYDTAVLSNPVVVKAGTLSATKTVQSVINPSDKIGKFSLGVSAAFNPATDGVLVSVQFDVAANFTGTSAIQIVSDNTKSTFFQADYTQITATFNDGSIKAVDSTGPAVSNLQVTSTDIPVGTASIVLTASIDDSASGKNNIKAAEYFINTQGADGAGTAMSAADGAFNSMTENVTATINTSAWTVGTYTIYVHGQDSENNWGTIATKTVTVYQAPAAPTVTNVDAATANNKPAMSWTAVNGLTYDFQLASDANFVNVISTLTGSTASNFTPSTALTDGTYYWQVRAIDANNHAGAWTLGTAFTVDTTAPAMVQAPTVTPQANGDLKLDWTNPQTDFAGVVIVAATGSAPVFTPTNGTTYTVGQNGVVAVGNINTFTDTPLVNGTHRYYKIFAYDSLKNYAGAVSADGVSADTEAPANVTNQQAAAGDTKVTLSWTNPTTSDFAGVLIIYYPTATPPTAGPAHGSTYNVNDNVNGGIVGYKGNATTTQITGLTNGTPYTFAIYAYDERPNYSTGVTAAATPVPFGITTPAPASVDVTVGGQVPFAATGPSGSFNWTATGGTLSAATGASVTWTAPATVNTSPTAYTVTLTDGVNANLTDTRTVNVYSNVAITNKPSVTPTIQPGQASSAYSVSGGNGTYTWTVKDAGNNTVDTKTGATYTFQAPSAGNFAGQYTIAATDGRGTNTASFNVYVPITVTPKTLTFGSKKTDGTANTVGFTAAGAVNFDSWQITDSSGSAVTTPGDYGTWANATTATPTFTSAAVTSVKTFYVKATPTGLNPLTVGPFSIIPMVTYTLNVTGAAGALSGVTITVNYDLTAVPASPSAGAYTFTLPDSGTYTYTLSKTGYVNQVVTSKEKVINVTMVSSASSISGNVQDNGAANLAGVKVIAYQPASYDPAKATTWYESPLTVGTGNYTINLPAGAPNAGWTVVASKNGYNSVSQTNQATGTVNFTGANALTAAAPATTNAGDKSATTTINTAGGVANDTTVFTYNVVAVTVPAGGLADNANVKVVEAATSAYTPGSPVVYEVTAKKVSDGTNAGVNKIFITLPFRLDVVKPGYLENGTYVIYYAATAAALAAGGGTAVPTANIVNTDYTGDGTTGSVTFWVDHLTAFGIGAAAGSSSSTGAGKIESTSGCFIATAAYGSYLDKHVEVLRNFRDAYLLTNSMGRAFVAFYYRNSPPLADFIAAHDSLRAIVRIGLAPLVGMSYVAIHTSMAQKILILAFLTGGLVFIGMAIRKYRRRMERV